MSLIFIFIFTLASRIQAQQMNLSDDRESELIDSIEVIYLNASMPKYIRGSNRSLLAGRRKLSVLTFISYLDYDYTGQICSKSMEAALDELHSTGDWLV